MEDEEGLHKFALACGVGDVRAVAAYLRNVSTEIPFCALLTACAKGQEDVVQVLLEHRPRIVWKSNGDDVVRHLLPALAMDEIYAYELAHLRRLNALYTLLVEHAKTTPAIALCIARDVRTLRTLLNKSHVALTINVVCIYIVNKRVDLLRVLADTPWLGFSRRTLLHLQTLAEKHEIPHVFPVCERPSVWESEESNYSVCYALHSTTPFRYQKANPTVLAVVWCTHQVTTGWADMAEPLIDRLPPAVMLELDTEGPILNIPGAPRKAPGIAVRAFFWVAGIVLFGMAIMLSFHPKKSSPMWGLIFLVSAFSCILAAVLGPRQHKTKLKPV